ncbi:hypothetical protein BC332_18332 [Capsicum chinense]|nr:hypothetical protein BC332_18332 [Capsicum chinense]
MMASPEAGDTKVAMVDCRSGVGVDGGGTGESVDSPVLEKGGGKDGAAGGVAGGSFGGYQVAKIPYDIDSKIDSKEFSMFIFLPNKQNRLPSLLEKVNSNPKFFTQKFRLQYESLDAFYISKFKFTYTAKKEIVRTMKKIGLTLPFSKKCIEITEIVKPDGPFYINGIIQKTFIEVNEKGTEAITVTVMSDFDMGCSMYEAPCPRFVADHPFLFIERKKV